MDKFEVKRRNFHIKAIQNIMSRTSCFNKQSSTNKKIYKGDNITTYLRKYQIHKENQNLAKRILHCESQHNLKQYKKEWSRTQSYLRIRSNFKKDLCVQQPKIYKLQPILGKKNCIVTLSINKFQTSSVYFHYDAQYYFQIIPQHHQIYPNNFQFTLSTVCSNKIQFSIPLALKNKKMKLKIIYLKQNQIYEMGKFLLNLSKNQQQQINVNNKQKKIIATIDLSIHKQTKNTKQQLPNFNKQ